MTFLSKKHLLLPLLALSMALAPVAPAHADGPAVSLQISFGNSPHWDNIHGTSVREIRQGERGDYDMFRYGRNYYTYNSTNDRWYISRHYKGRFRLIDERSVPSQFHRIPRDHWTNYPSSWEDRGAQGSGGTSASFQVTFGTTPRWAGINGTRVEEVYGDDRPSYDVFRYGGSYYAYDNDRWYSSRNESGRFTMIDTRAVPDELSRVPRDHWRNYPPAWGNRDGKPGNGNGNGRGRSEENGHGHGNDRGGN